MIDLSKLPLIPEDTGHKGIDPFEAPIPGQSLTEPPGSLPYDRPPQYADPEEALMHIFQRLMQPRTAKQMLMLLEAGMPLSVLVEGIMTSGVQDGIWGVHTGYVMTPPVTVIMIRMAQSAGIQFNMTGDSLRPEETPDLLYKLAEQRVSQNAVSAAVSTAKKSAPELKDDHLKVGLNRKEGFF